MRSIGFIFLAVLGMAAHALELDAIYGSHMVLQRGCPVPICGTHTGAKPVTVEFNGQKVRAKQKGKRWQAVLPAMQASGMEGLELVVRQGEKEIRLENVAVGEVWIASGQSNMLWRLNQTPQSAQTIAQSESSTLRFYHAESQVHTNNVVYTEALSERLAAGRMYEGKWAAASPRTVARMSAVGYYFGNHLQRLLAQVPVGIIHCSLGGSEMMAWMPEHVLKRQYKDCLGADWLDNEYISDWVRGRARKNIGGKLTAPHPYKPGYLYETGIAPWEHFPVAGVIWYQGESDAELPDVRMNQQVLRDLIAAWRQTFRNKKMPFIQVQLPRINDKSALRRYWPEFRLVQALVAKEMPGVECVSTLDLGSVNSDVHPPRKIEVGERLAAVAAALVYGVETPYSGPVATQVQALGDTMRISFDHAAGLHTADGKAPVGFEVAGANKKYVPAEAEIEGNTVVLRSSAVRKPQYARYAWATFLHPNLVNEHKLPAVPFSPELYESQKKR